MAQTLQQVIKSLNSVYNPQVSLLQQRQKALPAQMQAEEQGLQAKQTQAYDEILGGARRRGLGFAGIPLQEQAKYNSTEYMPALARLRQQSKDQAMSLEEAILGVRERQQGTGLSYWQALTAQDQWQREFNEKKRQFDLQMAEQRAAAARAGGGGGFAPSFGDLGAGAGGGGGGGYGMKRRADGSYAFVGPNGQAISAATYSAGTGTPFRTLLSQMAQGGDRGAKSALGFVGDDYGYDPRKVGGNTSLAQLYNALTWGAMPKASLTRTTSAPRATTRTGQNISQMRWY